MYNVVVLLVVLCGLEVEAAQVHAQRKMLKESTSFDRESIQFLQPVTKRANGDLLSEEEKHFNSFGEKHQHGKPKDIIPLPDDISQYSPFEGNQTENPVEYLKCGVTHKAGSKNDKYELCPAECPYFAQNRKDDDFCTFACVPGDECGKWNENKPIPGHIHDSNTCRGPVVQFCKELTLDGKDTCSKCQWGWTVFPEDGQCYFTYWKLIYSIGVVLVILLALVAIYVTVWCLRPTINDVGVHQGHKFRSRCKILVPKDKLDEFFPGEEDDRRRAYPSDTSLCRTDVAGAGMLLHFNFQACLVLWPLCVALLWTLLATFHNELYIIGTRRFGTPRHNCILVAWGYETQQRLMWTKVLFLTIVYLGSFIGFIMFAVRQYRLYQDIDAMEKTMNDFALELEGIPPVKGAESVEEDIKNALEKAGCKNIVGVSVCWDYGTFQENIDRILNEVNADLVDEEIAISAKKISKKEGKTLRHRHRLQMRNRIGKIEMKASEGDKWEPLPPEDMGPLHKRMYSFEMGLVSPQPDPYHPDAIYGPDPCSDNTEEEPNKTTTEEEPNKTTAEKEPKKTTKEFLEELQCSGSAFVVFKTQEDRDAVLDDQNALEKLKTQAYTIGEDVYNDKMDKPLIPSLASGEPSTVNWHNFGADSSGCGMLKRFAKGFCCIYLPALAIWFFLFYVPYAYSLYNFNYDNGAQLPSYYGLLFTIIVVGGNATMYFVCDQVGDVIGFRYKDTKQVAYMLMYLVACMVNVLLDIVVTYYLAYAQIVGLDFRDYFGKRIEEYTTFTETFETYAMQRSLAENVVVYSFPSTFLIPFLLEPIITVWVPYQLGSLIVRTHKEIQGRCAEAYYYPFEFDLGRYADILLNMFLGILIFWFPGGYINTLFYGMAGSHLWIYCFDHYKVLHSIPSIKIVSNQVDNWAQLVLAGLCGMILSSLVFKANCEPHMRDLHIGYCLEGYDLIGATVIAGVAHTVLHIVLIFTLVPLLGMPKDKLKEMAVKYKTVDRKFEEIAKGDAYSWFTTNPVHCLRSKYVHKREPNKSYCRYASAGKEHLQEVNPAIGCYFSDKAAEAEEFDEKTVAKQTSEALGGLVHGISMRMSGKTPPTSARSIHSSKSETIVEKDEDEED